MDTSAYNTLADDAELHEMVREAVERAIIRILQTHIEEDQIRATPDEERRERMLLVPLEGIPTSHAVVGHSKVGRARVSPDGAFEEEGGNATSSGEMKDAIIAATGRHEVQVFVSRDARHHKRTGRFVNNLQVMDTTAFADWLGEKLRG